ncbi:MAG: sulfite exporter TauE/SafE family protein [Nitrospiraceae bacterium]
MDWHLWSLLGLGLLLGVRHALDPDHVAAVSTIVARTPSIWKSTVIGACWGLGHTTVLLLAGAVVIGFHLTIPPHLEQWFECAVGVMLVVLGLSLAWSLSQEGWHWHRHEHDGRSHTHLHAHRDKPETHHQHGHGHWLQGGLKPFLVGMLHGLAGSAGLLLVVLATVESVAVGLLYIAIFGIGSIVGMVAVGLLVSLPLHYAADWGPLARLSVRGAVSLATVVIGLWTIHETGVIGTLF